MTMQVFILFFSSSHLVQLSRNAQADLKKREVRDTENRRKVKINKADWLDNPDRYLIEMAGNRQNYAQYERNESGGASGN